MPASWYRIPLLFLFIVATIGTLLRAAPFLSLPLQYAHLVHAHSHVAFQGWIYTLLFLFLTHFFINKELLLKGYYRAQFTTTIVVIIGILLSFSLQGYGLYSIIFSTIFQLLNYIFIYRFFRDTRPLRSTSPISLRFIYTGLWLGLLSTLMPFAIGFAAAKGLNGTELYRSLVYTFLHLQYNGWFIFVGLGLWYKWLENQSFQFNIQQARYFHHLLAISVLPAIALSLLGMSFSGLVFVPAAVAAGLQGIGLYCFIASISPNALFALFQQTNRWSRLFFSLFLGAFLLKISLQTLSIFPIFWTYAFGSKYIVLAYLHLMLLGVLSFLLMGLLLEIKKIVLNKSVKIGSILIIMGFFSTELLLLLQGFAIYNDPLLLAVGSGLIALGVLSWVLNPAKTKD